MPGPVSHSSTPTVTGWYDGALAGGSVASPAVEQDGDQISITGPAYSLHLAGDRCTVHISDEVILIIIGTARDEQMRVMSPADVARVAGADGASDGRPSVNGRFALIHLQLLKCAVTLTTDRFAVHPLCFAVEGTRIAFSDRANSVPLRGKTQIDLQAIFNFVSFHVIPAPRTIFLGVHRLEAARQLSFDLSGLKNRSTWQQSFAPKRNFDQKAEGEQFRRILARAVEREATLPRLGAFLSGGTDSSTVVGLMTELRGEPVNSFSIGFDASGYDEMSYARIAARKFGSTLHEHYITPAELVLNIPQVAAHYDQPFGNSSALPAYLCARLAHDHNVDKLLAGDGGDELFGGNTRYARQKVFAAYGAVPSAIRQLLIEPLLLQSGSARETPGLHKLGRYVEQARASMPERMESYNLLTRFGVSTVFTPAFLECVNVQEPAQLQRTVYSASEAQSVIDRMLAYDWRFTLSDSDLPKVASTARLAAIQVGFPMLDDELVDFSMTLPASMKVGGGLALRPFFKSALRDFLPSQIISKKKHGFGLPFGPWLVRDAALLRFATSSLDQLAARGVIPPALVHDLFSARLAEHPGFYGEMVWVLMMLEHWLARHAPSFKVE